MDAVFSKAIFLMDHINYAAIVTALVHVWDAAQHSDRFRSDTRTHDRLEALYQRCVQSLHPVLADMHAQGFSTVLWSSAKLGFSPDTVVPGMVQDLTHRFSQLIYVSEERQRPIAQQDVNMLWALATLGHPAAEVVESVCLHFASLMPIHSSALTHRKQPMRCGSWQPWVINQQQRCWTWPPYILHILLKAPLPSSG